MENILDFETFGKICDLKMTRDGMCEFYKAFYEITGNTETVKIVEKLEATNELRLAPEVKELAIRARNRKALKKASASAVKALRGMKESMEYNNMHIASNSGSGKFSVHDTLFMLECIFYEREKKLTEEEQKLVSERVEAILK